MIRVGRESKRVPPEYAEYLARAGGTNFFGEPNYILVWGESDVSRTPFGDMLLTPIPCWILAEWHSPEEWLPWDSTVLGAFPNRGKYHLIQPFYEKIKGQIVPMQLNFKTFEVIISVAVKHRHDSEEKRLALLQQARAEHDKAMESRIADNLQDAVEGLSTGPVSFAGQTNKHSYVQQMVARMEAQMGRGVRMNKGLQQA